MHTFRLDIDKAEFKNELLAILSRRGVSLQVTVTAAIKTNISQQLEQLVAAGTCLRYRFKNGKLSLMAAIRGYGLPITTGGTGCFRVSSRVDGTVLLEGQSMWRPWLRARVAACAI